MKKKLFFLLSLVAVLFTVTVFTSCGDDDDPVDDGSSIVVSCNAVVYHSDNIDQATLSEIKAGETALNQRIVKLCGKEFQMKFDKQLGNVPNDAREAHAERLYGDSEFHGILEKLSKLTTTDGKPGAVIVVHVDYYSGPTKLYSWEIQ